MISDTHGLIRPEAIAALAGVDRILHAGDIGKPCVLQALAGCAPLTAIRGNNDRDPWADAIPTSATIELGNARIYLIHDLGELDFDPLARGIRAVVSGHSHQPRVEERGGVLYLNPGSAGPRRFRLPVTLARLVVARGRMRGEIVTL